MPSRRRAVVANRKIELYGAGRVSPTLVMTPAQAQAALVFAPELRRFIVESARQSSRRR